MDQVQSPISPFFFDIHLSTTSIIILSAALLFCVIAIFMTWQTIVRVLRHKRLCDAANDEASRMPDVSVVVFSQDNAENLETLIPAILNQNYNGGIEVIVVNDGESSSVSRVVGLLKMTYPNIYMTYTPDGARNLSRKKLAITLGVKAARNPIVIHTYAGVKLPEGGNWLQGMMRHFKDQSIEVVLGFAAPVFASAVSHIRTICFDYMADNITWISSALAGKPYMGTFLNIAYRREVFFENKGFSRSLRFNNGEDDIFVNEITNSENTAVELATDTIVDSNYIDIEKDLDLERQAHEFTSRFVPRKARRKLTLNIVFLWLALACSIAGIAISPLNLATAIAAVVILIATLVWPTVYWAKVINALGGRKLRFTVPWLLLTRPIRKALLKLRARTGENKNYTWN